MHESSFPQSAEDPAMRNSRAIKTLEWEDSHGLGFRRRKAGGAASETDPGDYSLRDMSSREVVGGWLAAVGAICAATSLVFKPLIFAMLAVVLAVGGLTTGPKAHDLSRNVLIVACVCFVVGMLLSVITERAVF